MSKKVSVIATGRRKTAVAQVILTSGSGNFSINGKEGVVYLQNNIHSIGRLKAPLKLLNFNQIYDFRVRVKGGGLSGQAEAIQLGISRALRKIGQLNTEQLVRLKSKGFLRTNSRVKERKKYGLKKARKAPQYSKR